MEARGKTLQQDGEDVRAVLKALANRIRAAGERGRGVKISAREARLLLSYNLPCTADTPDVMDGD